MSSSRSGISVVRLSNIYDRRFSGDQFLDRVVRSARMGSIRFETAPESERDFIEIDDAVDGILAVAQRGNARIYNVATGTNTSNAGIADALADRFQARIEFAANAPVTRFRPIDVSGLRKIHDRPARLVTDALRTLV
jgi:nucleoside-diphosphate-sugar epimerase